jgi:hypothetical protein
VHYVTEYAPYVVLFSPQQALTLTEKLRLAYKLESSAIFLVFGKNQDGYKWFQFVTLAFRIPK